MSGKSLLNKWQRDQKVIHHLKVWGFRGRKILEKILILKIGRTQFCKCLQISNYVRNRFTSGNIKIKYRLLPFLKNSQKSM